MIIDDLIGIPYVAHGRTLQGLDCYGLVKEVYKRCGQDIPEYDADYRDVAKITEIINNASQSSCWQRVSGYNEVPLLLTLRMGVGRGSINHTAIYIGNGKFIHTRQSCGGVCIESIDSPAWQRCIEGAYRYAKVSGNEKPV